MAFRCRDMSQRALGYLLRELRTKHCRELMDGDLLERFCATREEAAFGLLLQRHGPMFSLSAGGSFTTSTTPRMPFRRRFSCWFAGRAPSAGGPRWAAGCTASPGALLCGPK